MPERRPVVQGLRVKYSGLFKSKELWKTMDSFLADNGFGDRVELTNDEVVKKDKKDVYVKYKPYKKVSDYVKIEFIIEYSLSNLVKKTVTKDGHKINLEQGDVDININGFINTDYEGRWENTPQSFFIRTIIDKFIFKTYTGKYEGEIKSLCYELKSEIESFLNIHRY